MMFKKRKDADQWNEEMAILGECLAAKGAANLQLGAALRAHHRVEERMNGDGSCAVCGPAVWALDDAHALETSRAFMPTAAKSLRFEGD